MSERRLSTRLRQRAAVALVAAVATLAGIMSTGLATAPAAAARPVSVSDQLGAYVAAHPPGSTVGSGQCVALVNGYLDAVFGFDTAGQGVAYASDMAAGRSGAHVFSDRSWSWSTDSNSGDFHDGDVLVWSYSAGSSAGHTAIWFQGGLYEQNAHNPGLTISRDPWSWMSRATFAGRWIPPGGGGGTPPPPAVQTGSLAVNGGFEQGAWAAYPGTASNTVAYHNGQVRGISAHSGLNFEATNTATSGGGVYEDVPTSTQPGGLLCASAWVSGSSHGQFVVWLLGGSYTENGVVGYSTNDLKWHQIKTCVASTTSHSDLRIQLYPAVNGGTTYLDDVDVHASLATNGGFEQGSWATYPGTRTNVVAYRNGQVRGISAHSGLHFEATNTATSGGGIYEDVPLSTGPGGLYCASVWVSGSSHGQFVVWLLGGSYTENGVAAYSTNDLKWHQIQTCVASTTPHSDLRIQVYPAVNGGTTYLDDVDVHASRTVNGGFEQGAWAGYPGTVSNTVAYRNGQVRGISAHSGLNFEATNTATSGGGVSEDAPLSTGPGGLFCASVWVSGSSHGQFVVWLLGGSYTENGVVTYSSNDLKWHQVQTCVASTTAHSTMRVQVYPAVNGGTTYLDDVDVH